MTELYHSHDDTVAVKMRAARAYVARGWSVFVLGRGKTPVGNCAACRPENAGPGHDRRTCECLTCHAHYAATTDLDRVARMLAVSPDGWLAVATGVVSNLIVLDADTRPDPELTGPEVLEYWDVWTGGAVDVPPYTLRQETGSGGFHLLYRADGWLVPGRRVLPGLDVKAEGGYIAVGPSPDGRRWVNWDVAPVPLPETTREWLRASRGRTAAYGVGGGFGGLRREVELGRAAVPAGSRDTYARDLAYALRRADIGLEEALETARRHWERFDQDGPGMSVDFPWAWVEHKVRRTYAMIEPEPGLGVGVAKFIQRAVAERDARVIKRGNVTITRRSR